jgi:hypothetical protein
MSRYALVHDAVLTSRHTEGRAIDMTISSVAGKSVKDASGNAHTVTSLADLNSIGASYGVQKLVSDPPH